jgi:hypothetical protein
LQLSAQKPLNEFSINAGGGTPIRSVFSGICNDAGLGFTTFFNPQFGFHTGIGFGWDKLSAGAGDLKTTTFGLTDENDYLFDKYTTLSGYKETQNATFFCIPVMLQYQHPNGLYAMGGTKIIFRHQVSYETKLATLNNIAYYPEFDNWSGTQTFAGLGTFDGVTKTGDLKIGSFMVFALETGMKWRVRKNIFFYTGIFFDYNPTDPAQNHRKLINNYTAPEHLPNLTLLKFSGKINLTTIGLKLRLSFSK